MWVRGGGCGVRGIREVGRVLRMMGARMIDGVGEQTSGDRGMRAVGRGRGQGAGREGREAGGLEQVLLRV